MNQLLPEVIWQTDSGLPAMVIMTELGHRCGYVGVPVGHPLYGIGYSEETDALKRISEDTPIGQRGPMVTLKLARAKRIPSSPEVTFDVHDGLTFSGAISRLAVKLHIGGESLWWFGYDCGHYMDAPSGEYQRMQREKYPDKPYMWAEGRGVHRTLGYCRLQCESLADQITTQTRSRFSIWLRKTFLRF